MISVAHAATGGAHGGNFFATPEFWVAMAFLVVVGFVIWKGGPRILAALDKRGQDIKARLDEARKLREDAQAMLADYQRRQRDALKEAEEIVQHAREEAERMRIKAEEALEASLHRRERQAVERLAQAEAQAIADVRSAAADLAVAASARLMDDTLSDEDRQRLLDASIKGVSGHLN